MFFLLISKRVLSAFFKNVSYIIKDYASFILKIYILQEIISQWNLFKLWDFVVYETLIEDLNKISILQKI